MTYTVAKNTGSITLGGDTTSVVTVASPMRTTTTLTVDGVDVGEFMKLMTFFLESRHPEVFEEFNAIEKIKKS